VVVEHGLEFGRQLGIGAQSVDEPECLIVQSLLAQFFQKLESRSRVPGRFDL
jgi:hypothetical protein